MADRKDWMNVGPSFAQEIRGLLNETVETGRVLSDFGKIMVMEKAVGYEGCRNCKYQIEPFRACEWLEKGKHQTVYLVCPRWERRENG